MSESISKLEETAVERASTKTTERVVRTRQLIQQELSNLLKEKELDGISVDDIAEAATRATQIAESKEPNEKLADIPQFLPEKSVDPRILRGVYANVTRSSRRKTSRK